MSATAPTALKELFLSHYDGFRKRLRRRLGSNEAAEDVLQETWLKVQRLQGTEASSNPEGYLFRMALNVAADQRDASERLLTGLEVEELLDESRQVPGPAAAAAGQFELEELAKAVERLPRRQREILIAARVDEIPLAEIAQRHRISVRMVGKELKAALQFCGRWLERDVVQRFGPGAGNRS